MKRRFLTILILFTCAIYAASQNYGNPYLPMWEHIPDGEPYVFDDPDNPGKQRVYIYGSHDTRLTDYCGRELVVWSAPIEDLSQWRYDGEILRVDRNANGQLFNGEGLADVLFAPDVAVVTESNGKKTYYLYPNDQEEGRQQLIAKSDRPNGPFTICNWSKDNPNTVNGILRFDPAVLVDDDGRVYGYWGFTKSYAAELDPMTMATVKPGTEIKEDMVPSKDQAGEFRFFEASSIRKIQDKYVFIYSRWTADGDFGMYQTNYTLAYAYSDHPLGPWTYGGTIIDGRAREHDEHGNIIASATPTGNTHGSICKIGTQWYVFYHRQTGLNEYARQAMVAPITVSVETGKGGKVSISEGEYTSEGFALDGLDPTQCYSAGIACWFTGPTLWKGWGTPLYSGSYIEAGYGTADRYDKPYALHNNSNRIVNNIDGSIVGYKYFNFTKTHGRKDVSLSFQLIPTGIDGTIQIMLDRPWQSQGGKQLGTIRLKKNMSKTSCTLSVRLPQLAKLTGKHALYLKFTSPNKEQSLCTLESLMFK